VKFTNTGRNGKVNLILLYFQVGQKGAKGCDAEPDF